MLTPGAGSAAIKSQDLEVRIAETKVLFIGGPCQTIRWN